VKCSKVTLWFFIFQYIPLSVIAQDSISKDHKPNRTPGEVIKLSPLHLINFYPSVQVAYEHPVSLVSSLQIDLGFVFHNYGSPDFINKRGIKSKLEFKYYLRDEANYLSIEPYFNGVNFHRRDSLLQCFDLDCTIQFSQSQLYLVQYRETGFSLKFGQTFEMGSNFLFDLNYGLTFRLIDYAYKGRLQTQLPPAGSDSWLINEGKRTGVSPALGIRFGYVLRPSQ
jgi:hypothetical protein